MDLGFQWAGIPTVWMCERDRRARTFLRMRFPDARIYHDVRAVIEDEPQAVDVIHGGDPCPRHSRARQVDSDAADLSGYFLAVVARCGPAWVVRENVLAPSVDEFATALEALGYGTVIIRIDGAEITGQSRPREFVVGRREAARRSVRDIFSDAIDFARVGKKTLLARQVSGCLDTRAADRLSWYQGYIFDRGRIRVFDCEERERLAGLPAGWTAGFSRAARAQFTGNAVIPWKTKWIAERIVAAETESVFAT